MASSGLALRKAEVVVVEFEPPAFLAAIQVERFYLFPEIGQLAQEEVPAGVDAADPDWELAQAAERDFAMGARRSIRVFHGLESSYFHTVKLCRYF
jgi:hypothetical protein